MARDAGIVDIVAVMHPGIAPPAGIRSVVNPDPASEQIASLRLGLAQLTNAVVRGTLVWPVDHPFVRSSTIVAILDEVRASDPLIAVPIHGARRGHPTYFSRDVWRDIVTATQGGAREVLKRFASEVREVAVADPGILRNVDTKDDLRSDS